jgi:hypothetical protein
MIETGAVNFASHDTLPKAIGFQLLARAPFAPLAPEVRNYLSHMSANFSALHDVARLQVLSIIHFHTY